MQENAKRIAELLKVLANENRLLILCALMSGPKTVSEIAPCVSGITQSALSQHLSILKANGILDNRKTGQNSTYFMVDRRVEEVIQVLKQYYCQ